VAVDSVNHLAAVRGMPYLPDKDAPSSRPAPP